MWEQIAADAVETPTVEQLQASLAKAEAKIVSLKTTEKETTTTAETETADKEVFSREDAERLVAEALKAQAITKQEETYEQNQAQTNSMSISGEWEATSSSTFDKISLGDYDAMSQAQQNDYYKTCIAKTWELDFA